MCAKMLPADPVSFRRDRARQDGLSSRCRNCSKKVDVAYRAKRDKKAQAEAAKRWRDANPEYQKAWRENNPDYHKQWRAENPGYDRKWAAANPGYFAATQSKCYRNRTAEQKTAIQRAKRAKRRKQLASSIDNFKPADVTKAIAAQKNTCWWCASKLDQYHVDHRIPLAKGGGNGANNIVISCPPCNQKRGAKMPWEGPAARLL